MANYANLKATINANIKANGTEAITGPVLNSVLTAAVNTLGAGYQFMGVATTSTNPGTPDANVFYIAATPGTYTNFGGKTVADGEVAILKYNGSWTKEVTGAATAAQLTQLGQKIDEFAQGKFYGYFGDADELPAGDIPGFAYVGTAAPFAIYNFDGSDWSDSGLTIDEIPIGNGEDIDTDADGKLQFANRTYNSLQPDGMGYKILRKDATFAEQVTDANTIYEIRYEFNLGGESVTIPEGCVLRFDGGELNNGTLIGEKTQLAGELSGVFNNIEIDGSWNVPIINSNLFTDIHEPNKLHNLFLLCSDDIFNTVIIEKGNYYQDKTQEGYKTIYVKSNTKIRICGNIYMDGGQTNAYFLFFVGDYDAYSDGESHDIITENVVFEGSGVIIGDRDTNNNASEYGWLLFFWDCNNIRVDGLTFKKSHGDNIYIHGICNNVSVENCTIEDARRNGITHGAGTNYTINNCTFRDIGRDGVSPKCAIEMEADHNFGDLANCIITNNDFYNCESAIITSAVNNRKFHGFLIKNNNFYECKGVLNGSYSNDKALSSFIFENNTIVNSSVIFYSGVYGEFINIRICNNVFKASVASSGGAIQLLKQSSAHIANNSIETPYHAILMQGDSKAVIENNSISCTSTDSGNALSSIADGQIIKNNKFSGYVDIQGGSLIHNNTFTYIRGGYAVNLGLSINSKGFSVVKNKVYANNYTGWLIYATCSDSIFDSNTSDNPDKTLYATPENNNLVQTIERIGSLNALPSYVNTNYKGTRFYDTDTNKWIVFNGYRWIDDQGYNPAINKGPYNSRPVMTSQNNGFEYYDTDINKGLTYFERVGALLANELITDTPKYIANPFPANKMGCYQKAYSGTFSLSLYFAKGNTADAETLLIDESTYGVANEIKSFPTPDPSVYPYIKAVSNRSAGLRIYLKNFRCWDEFDGAAAGIVRNGTSVQRPAGGDIYIGFVFFDADLNKPIWYTGSGWVDATGASV